MPNLLGGKSMYQRLVGSGNNEMDMSWLCSHVIPADNDIDSQRKRNMDRPKTARWGPTHSFSSDEDDDASKKPALLFEEEKKTDVYGTLRTPTKEGAITKNYKNNSQDTESTKSSYESASPKIEVQDHGVSMGALSRVWNNIQCLDDTTSGRVMKEDEGDRTKVMDLFDSVCSPCKPRNLDDTFSVNYEDTPLGIARLAPPNSCSDPTMNGGSLLRNKAKKETFDEESTNTVETAADRRRERHKRRQQKSGQRLGDGNPEDAHEVTKEEVLRLQNGQKKIASLTTRARPIPLKSLELNSQQAFELERCISELTMRSSYGEATAKIAENRRMAYYAVGKHHRQSGRGGNRRCYFTGKLILGGAPFYAGSVQQGLRTLVVFCLPSAVGLPKETQGTSSSSRVPPTAASVVSGRRSNTSNRNDGNSSVAHSLGRNGNIRSIGGASLLSRKNSRGSRLSSMDDATSLGYSVEEELDPNWELDREYLLRVLPEPEQQVLDEMAKRYPTQFETLPLQVRSPSCWSLYVKFCFFSGLPIAEGEMHYKVRDTIADGYGEEIILSHEVMEAVNGESAEILRLPNLKTFRYLRKHYHQQSAKLPDNCFQRQAWEMVRPEV